MIKQSTIASVIGAGLMLATTAFADPYNPADRAVGGGLLGAGTGAIIGAIGAAGMVLASVRRSAGAWAPSRAPQAHLSALIIITSVGSRIIRIEPSGDPGAAPEALKPGEISLPGHAPGRTGTLGREPGLPYEGRA